MKRVLIAALVAGLMWGGPLAAQMHDPASFAGQYSCTDIASTGFSYSQEESQWRQVSFYPETISVRFDLIETYEVESMFTPGLMEPFARYSMITTSPSGYESACWSYSGEDTVEVNEYAWVRCRGFSTVWSLNLATGRFVKALVDGFAGENEGQYGSTPSVTLGSCVRTN